MSKSFLQFKKGDYGFAKAQSTNLQYLKAQTEQVINTLKLEDILLI